MTHSSGEGLALNTDHHDRTGGHIAHSFCTDHAGLHVPHTARAILGYGPTKLYLLSQICYESYSTTETLLCSALLLPGARPGSASNLCRPLTGKVELTLLFELQL